MSRTAQNARQYRAWRVTSDGNSYPLDIASPESLEDAKAEAVCGNTVAHKDTLLIHERDDARNAGTLYAFTVKQKSQPEWRKCPETLVSKPFRPLYLAEAFTMAVDAFEPKRPFDAFRDPASGRDPSLIQAA